MERRSGSGAGLAALGALGRRLLWALPAYAAGLLGLGAGALVLALALYAGWRRRRRARERGMRAAERLQRDEEAAVRAAAAGLGAARGELPAWVSFPDVERAEWLNKVLAQAWPFFGQYMEKLLVENVAPSIRASNTHLQTFTFTKVDMGEKPLRVLGVRAHPGTHKKQILLDLNISYVGDVQIDVEVKKFFCKAGVKGMQLHGMLRIILEPLLGDVPIVGALTMFFIRRPVVCNTSAPVWEDAFRFFLHDPRNQDVDIQVKDDPRQTPLGSLSVPLSRLLEAPELTLDEPFPLQRSGPGSRLFMKLVLRVLFLDAPEKGVAPPVPPGQTEPPASTESPPRPTQASPDPRFGTEHVLRIHLLEAENLIAKDNFFKGMVRGRSDPYAKVRVAGRVFRSRVIKEELNPRWNEVYEVIVDNIPGQDVEFDLFDKDVDKDDFLGRCKVPLRRVLSSCIVDEWLPLEEVKSGRLHVKLENLDPRPSTALLEQVLHTNSLLQPARGEELSAALLSVFVDQAADLPLRKGSKAPSAFASLAVGNVSFKTKTCAPSAEPVWDEGFSFLIKRPHEESLQLQVKEEGGQPLGSLSLPLPQLLASEGLALDGWFPLAGGGPGTQILLRAQLGVLVSQQVEAGAGGSLEGGDTDPQPTEARGEQEEEEECGTGGLRQRLPPVDSPPEPAEGPRLQLTLWYHRDERKLVAIVHACRELRAAAKELPDPYVSLVLLPDRSRGTKRKTSVQRKTLNPDFNERFEWDLSLEEVSRRRLEAHVKSTLSFMTREKEALGKLHLNLAQVDLSEGGSHWYELQDERSGP
ncbi:extended synaptotagmin-1 [Empidonax traillii]|uniref:extended synaptotagmin-1 n=1 Tax=Empidonax traillii TaxID=164674 RepID=UPI000FFD3132|nr:extended synaptotagmin-1 [Empidonax traillii]